MLGAGGKGPNMVLQSMTASTRQGRLQVMVKSGLFLQH